MIGHFLSERLFKNKEGSKQVILAIATVMSFILLVGCNSNGGENNENNGEVVKIEREAENQDKKNEQESKAKENEENENEENENDEISDSKINSASEFGINVFKALENSKKDKNVIVSPFSISSALTMALNGADGNTLDEMKSTLGITNDELLAVNEKYKAILEILKSKKDIDVSIANSFWAKNGIGVKEDFIGQMKEYFSSEVFEKDYQYEEVNKWVEEKTKGKISKIIDDNSSDAILLNAIYFKADWKEAFDENKTSEQDFTNKDGSITKVDMMFADGEYEFYSDEEVKGVKLPYKDEDISFYVFVNIEKNNMDDFIQELDEKKLNEYIDGFEMQQDVKVKIPKFKVDYSEELNEALKTLGIKEAFSRSANFSNLAEKELYIDSVKHKTAFEIDEKGTEAAAATSVEMRLTAVMPTDEEKEITVDKPFFFVIRDEQLESLIFMGNIENIE